MEINSFDQAQDWVDKLAAMNANITKNDIMAWANSAPLIQLDNFETIPLFLYGDATIDSAITDILKYGASEPKVNDIYGILKTTAVPAMNQKIQDINLNPETVASLPVSNNKPGDWNAVLAEAANREPVVDEKKREKPLNTVNRPRIGDNITLNKYKSAHCSDAEDNSQNAVHFSNGAVTAEAILASNPLIQQHGFEVCEYDDENCMLSNGPLTYVVNKNSVLAGHLQAELNNGYEVLYQDIPSFIRGEVETQPLEMQNYFSRKQFSAGQVEAGVPVQETISFTMAQLANLMNLFANDLLYMHHHAVGDDFDTIHSITQNLYEKAGEHVDMLSEMALRLGEDIGNLANAQTVIDGQVYTVITEGDINIDRMEQELNVKGAIILGALKRCQQYGSEIMSKLDEIIYDWATEIEYKNNARMKNFALQDNPDDGETDGQSVIDEAVKTATVVVDTLSNEYGKHLDAVRSNTLLFESKCQILKQKQLTKAALEEKLANSDNPESIQVAIDAIDAELPMLDEELNELLVIIREELAQCRLFEKVTESSTRKEFKQSLKDIVDEKAASTQNFSSRRRNNDDDDDGDDLENKHAGKLSKKETETLYNKKVAKKRDSGTPYDNGRGDYVPDLGSRAPVISPREKIRRDAENDVYEDYVKDSTKLNNEDYQHIAFLKKYVDESKKRQLEEIFEDYDRDRELDRNIWSKGKDLDVNDIYLERHMAQGFRENDLRQQYLEDNLDRDVAYQIRRNRLMDKEAARQAFETAAIDGTVDIIVNELPNDKIMSTYSKVIGNNLMNSNPYLDKLTWNTLGVLTRNKDTLGNIAKAAIKYTFSNTSRLNRDINYVTERLLHMGFSHKELEPVISGRMFARIPEECLDVDSMTKEAITHITGSVRKGRLMFSNMKKSQRNHRNFSNENYELVNMNSMDARYKYNMCNPRYNYDESNYQAGDNSDDKGQCR